MGRVTDRSKEHLGFSDAYVIAVRRFYVKAVKSFMDGREPPGVNIADSSEIDLTADVVPWEAP
jgi:hypothetical protein